MTYDTENFPSLPASWATIAVVDGAEVVSVVNKVPARTYLNEGALQVIDQGSSLIGGYTDDLSLAVATELPVVVFGDHTRVLKYITQPFAAGADGIKVLRAGRFFWPRTFFQFLRAIRLPDRGYARHFQFLRASLLPVPPLSEQKRIADKLDALLARVEACRERIDRVPTILKRFRQSVLHAATNGELTREWREKHPAMVDARPLARTVAAAHAAVGGHKIGNAAPPTDGVHDLSVDMFPSGWSLLTLRDLVQPDRPITYGILKPGPELDEGVPYVRVADFPNDRLTLSTIRKTSRAMDEEFKRSRLQRGDLLLSIRGTVGRLVVVPPELERGNITQDTARLSLQAVVNPAYVLWALRSELVQRRMRAAVKGVAVRGINIGDVRALQVPLPSRAEQDEIVRRVEELLGCGDHVQEMTGRVRTRVERLTHAILAKGFRGELVPQDPDDEPASELLARIRSHPAVVGTPGKPTRGGTRVHRTKIQVEADMLARKDVTPTHLTSILKQRGALTAEALWTASQLEIDEFYYQLRDEEAQGLLREKRGDSPTAARLLEAAA